MFDDELPKKKKGSFGDDDDDADILATGFIEDDEPSEELDEFGFEDLGLNLSGGDDDWS